jgi:two-component system cell cycle sensor histidine kinase/response regulator CckA
MNDPGLVVPADARTAAPGPSLEERYRDLFEGALLGIYTSRPDGVLLACNAAFARMLGFSSVLDAVGTGMRAVYDTPGDRDRFITSVQDHGRLEHYRARLRRRDGAVVDVIETVIGEFDADGALTELRGFLIDVTATADAERAAVERERQFRAVFVDAAHAMLILDDSRRIVEANPAACRLFELDAGSSVNRRLDDLLAGDLRQRTELDAAWREMIALGEAKREHRVRHGAGGTRLVDCSYRALVDNERHLWTARDISDRRLLEERLMQSEKIESIGRLAGGIAHDFNNLLTAILGYTELLLSSRGEADPDRPDLEEIQKAGQRAAALTQQLLAFSRKQVLMPKDVDLNQTVTAVQGMLVRLIREDITLSCELAPAPALIRIDPTQLEQVIVNLVLNARDALPGGGHIRLEVALVGPTQVEVPAHQSATPGDYVRLRVIDNGVGLSADARAHLFEPFFTTKDVGKGTGLGLASVYGIVGQSNGLIGVESAPGAGSTFTMHFPAVVRAEPPPAAAPSAAGAPPGGETILLVEDEDAVRVIVAAILRRQGYRVVEAATPGCACDAFALNARFDLLVSDVVMPEMNGPALAQRLVGLQPDLRVLFISGYTDMAALPLGGENPNISFLSKPFKAAALTERVREMLSRPARPRAGVER